MSEHQAPPESKQASAGLARRGILAGAAALLAGALARASERVAHAANGDPLIIGNTGTMTGLQSATATTQLINSTNTADVLYLASNGGGLALRALGGSSTSGSIPEIIKGYGTDAGIGAPAGTPAGTGVLGWSGGAGGTNTSGGLGVYGWGQPGNGTGRDGVGVRGDSGGSGRPGLVGVLGIADPAATSISVPTQRAGVYGLSNASATGVVGQSNNGVGCQGASNGNVGVLGTSSASHGLYGSSTNGYGVYATSANSTGIVASTNGGNAIQGASNSNVGVLGTSNSSIGGFFSSGTSTALYASGPAAGFAARFDGPVQVNGAFTVLGGPKSAAVPHPDGSHRRLYCVESPESWFEDFGRGQLANGRATVRLDRDFNALVHGDDYYVFLTPKGNSAGLYVSSQNPASFEVREQNGGTNNLAFDYRIVAKRKDIAGTRLEKVDLLPPQPTPAAPAPPPVITPLDPPRVDPHAPRPEPKPAIH